MEVWIQSRQENLAELLKSIRTLRFGMSGVDGIVAAGDTQVVFRCMWEQTSLETEFPNKIGWITAPHSLV